MICELAQSDNALARPLFGALGFHLSVAAVLAGTMPGRVFADDPARPRAALMSSPEGCYLAGAGGPGEVMPGFGQAAIDHLRAAWPELWLFVDPAWEPQIAADRPAGAYTMIPRRRYALRSLAGDWHLHLPAQLSLARLAAPIFARPDLADHHIQRWARGNWGSVEAFLERGFGFVIFDGAQPASWCLADSAHAARCEVGIQTHPDYRRRGLATAVVAAACAHALASGYAEVGWHCDEQNRGSQGVAEKVGFQLTHRFHALAYLSEA